MQTQSLSPFRATSRVRSPQSVQPPGCAEQNDPPGIRARIQRQREQHRRRRAIAMVTTELMRRLQINAYDDGLVLPLTGRTSPSCNRDAVEEWVALVLMDAERPNLAGLAMQLRCAIDAGVEPWD